MPYKREERGGTHEEEEGPCDSGSREREAEMGCFLFMAVIENESRETDN